MQRYDLVAIHLKQSNTTIYTCPLCVYDLDRLPIRVVWKYA